MDGHYQLIRIKNNLLTDCFNIPAKNKLVFTELQGNAPANCHWNMGKNKATITFVASSF